MQQILNSQDRSQAFLKFLLFFLITIGLVIAAIYFNFRVPVKENEWLQNKLEIQLIENATQEKFVSKMVDASFLLDSMSRNGSINDLVKGRFENTMNELQALQQSSTTLYGRMNKVIIEKFTELKKAKVEATSQEGNSQVISDLKRDLNDCNLKLAIASKSGSPIE